MSALTLDTLDADVRRIVAETPILDIHTHLYPAAFGLTLSGADELLTYHYLIAELMRVWSGSPEAFFALSKTEQADLIWQKLFVERAPISEATTGIITVFSELGLDPNARDLSEARAFFASRTVEQRIDDVLRIANVTSIVMTNDPLDSKEAIFWNSGGVVDPRFHAALRIDAILNDWPNVATALREQGYDCQGRAMKADTPGVQRFLADWIGKMNPKFLAASLPPDFEFPNSSPRSVFLRDAVLPICQEYGLPFMLLIGVNKRANPRLVDAGDSVGVSDVTAAERLCDAYPDVKFLVTMLARENQHALCVAARKYSNLLPFGCWWFMNNPLLVEETTRMRLETLGTTFVPQHSDARVLEQVIYKWKHSRRDVGTALAASYRRLMLAGGRPTAEQLEQDARRLLHDNAAEWIGFVSA